MTQAGGWTNPIVGGSNQLIREEIKSPNYVAGSTGWNVAKDGTAEFNSLTARGSIEAGGGAVRLNAGGVKVTGATKQYDINIAAGFLARKVPDDGALMQLAATSTAGLSGFLGWIPPTPSALGNVITTAFLYGYMESFSGGTDERPVTRLTSPQITGKQDMAMTLVGQSNGSADFDGYAELVGGLHFNSYGIDAGRGRVGGTGTTATVGPVTTTETVVMTVPSRRYYKGRLYTVTVNAPGTMSVAANRTVSRLRKGTTIAGTQLAITGHQFSTTTTGNFNCGFEFYVGSSDVVTELVWTILVANGAVSASVSAGATMSVRDEGIAAETGFDAYGQILV